MVKALHQSWPLRRDRKQGRQDTLQDLAEVRAGPGVEEQQVTPAEPDLRQRQQSMGGAPLFCLPPPWLSVDGGIVGWSSGAKGGAHWCLLRQAHLHQRALRLQDALLILWGQVWGQQD